MKKLLRASLCVSALVVFGLLLPSTAGVNAQTVTNFAEICKNNEKCLSFDPAVNPMLKGYTVNTKNDSKGKPTEQPDGSTCVLYNPPKATATAESGCLKAGVFTLNGTLSSGEILIDTKTGSDGAQSADPNAASMGQSDTCNLDFWCTLSKFPGLLFSALAFLLLTLSSLLLGIAGVVFNWVVIRTVFQFALYFGTSSGMLVAWGVLRDIANIALLFTFIFVGIATILNTSSVEGYTAKKALPQLIIFAVLLNFSLFATQAVIDVANGFSSVFATYAGQEQCKTDTSVAGGTSGQSNDECANLGISSKILEAAGMHSINPFKAETLTALGQAWNQPYTYTVMLILLSLMVTVTAMVLLAAAIMLIIRVVVLSLLMVTSPIGFAGMAIPALHKIAQDWWSKLINQAFFAPLFLLMVFVSLKLVEGLQAGNATIADAILGNTANGATTAGNMQVIVVFMIVIGFMIGALMVAQKMGAYGASFATKTAGNLTFGAQGFVARRTVGRVSGKVAEGIRGSNWGHTEAGRLFAGFADKGAKASFDMRGNKAIKLPGGLNIGDAQKGGYDKIVHDGQEVREKYAKSLKQTDADKAEEKRLNDLKSQEEKRKSDSAARLKEMQTAGNEQISSQESANKAASTARTDARQVQEGKVKAALASGDAALAAREQTELERMATEHRDAIANEEAGIKSIRDQLKRAEKIHAQNIEDAERKIAAYDKRIKGGKDKDGNLIIGVGENASKYRYAQNLHDTQNSLINRVSAGGRANHHAYESIIRDAGKTKLQKALSAIEEEAKKGGGDDHGHAAPAAAHAPAPAGGGGGGHDAHAH